MHGGDTGGELPNRGVMQTGDGEKPDTPRPGAPAGEFSPAGVILRLAHLLTPGIGLAELASGLLDTACTLLGSDAAWILVLQDGELRLAAARGLAPASRRRLAHLPLDAPALEVEAVRRGRPVRYPREGRTEGLEWTTALLEEAGLPGAFATPAAHDGARAVVVISRKEALDPREEEIVQALARLGVRGFAGVHGLPPSSAPPGSAAAELERIRVEIERCRKVEAELRESEQRFRLTVEEAPIGIAVLSLTGRYRRVNKMLGEILGYSEAELLELRWQDVTHPDDLEEDVALRDALVAGTLTRYEMDKRYVRKDGSIVRANVGGALIRDADGAPWYFISRVQDMTERIAAEEALRASEQQLAEAQRIARVGSWELDLATDRVRGSAEGFRIFGYPQDQGFITREELLDAVHPDDRQRVSRAFREAVASEGTLELFHRIVRRDGVVRTIHSRAGVLRSQDRVRVVGAVQDITEEREAELERERLLHALAAERTWLDTLIERSPVAMILLDAEGRLRGNQRAHELIGPLGATATGTATGIELHLCSEEGTPLPPERMPLARAHAGESIHAEEICFRSPDGRNVTALVSAGPIHGENGEQLGVVALLDDISALKELERMREEWTSVVAHDLRQPVTVIHAQAQLLARLLAKGAPPGGKIEHIVSAARQLNRMIGDLLDVSRLEARRLTLNRRPLDLPAFAAEVAERMAEELAGHPFCVRSIGEVPPVEADPQRVEQILANLLSNAAKYGASDGPIEVEVEAQGDHAAVRVINEGPGIPAEELPALFERFYRARATKGKAVSGLGLGLYITRGLVEAHGGAIFASSAPGAKTTFTFTLPCVPPAT